MARSLLLPGDRPLINLGLVAATLGTTIWTYFLWHGREVGAWGWIGPASYGFAAVLILGSHEMGHYVLARIHGVDTTLPYFIPLPVPYTFGTLGAVIRIKSKIPNRNALVDIGASGPLVGLLVAIPIILWGIHLSNIDDVPKGTPVDTSLIAISRGLLHYLHDHMAGTAQPQAAVATGTIFGDSLLMKGLVYVVKGPIPAGKDIFAHPLVTAGWFGLLVTTLNLCPIGQLDGGHVTYAIFGRHAELIGRLASAGLLYLSLFHSVQWFLWFILTAKLIGFRHPEVSEPEIPLTRTRKIVAALCLVALVLCVVPVPYQQVVL